MLEQRRAMGRGYITLKEAAALSNYSPDYIGQLIRAGKIRGEQVYNNVSWVTTEDEVRAYLENKGRTVAQEAQQSEFVTLLLRYVLYGVIAICAMAILLLQYILYTSIEDRFDRLYLSNTESHIPSS